MRYLLDSNIVSDLVRNPFGRIAARINEVGETRVCTSIIVAAELRYGATKSASDQLARRVDGALARIAILPFDEPADRTYALVRTKLESAGMPISANDMLIAAHALAVNCVMVTDNEREFSRVDALTVINWLR